MEKNIAANYATALNVIHYVERINENVNVLYLRARHLQNVLYPMENESSLQLETSKLVYLLAVKIDNFDELNESEIQRFFFFYLDGLIMAF